MDQSVNINACPLHLLDLPYMAAFLNGYYNYNKTCNMQHATLQHATKVYYIYYKT